MIQKLNECVDCPLFMSGHGFSCPSGAPRYGVAIIGEALGSREAMMGEPFVGESGYQLGRILKPLGMTKKDFLVWNCCACQPPMNRTPTVPEIEHCDIHFQRHTKDPRIKAFLAVGDTPLRKLTGRHGVERNRGYVFESIVGGRPRYVVPTYHPAFLLRGMQHLTWVMQQDVLRAIQVAKDGWHPLPVEYILHPSQDDIKWFLEGCQGKEWLAADIETPMSSGIDEDEYGSIVESDILRISFAHTPRHAITIPWTSTNMELIQEILIVTPWTVWWNEDFDVPRIKGKGLRLNKTVDTMLAWHHLRSDLPKKLGYVSTFFTDMSVWKDLSQDEPQFYSCADSDATIRNWMGIKAKLEAEKRLDSFFSHVVDLKPILQGATDRGMPIDNDCRLSLKARLETEIAERDESIQGVVPLEVKPFKVRKRVPPAAMLGEGA